MGDYGRAFVNKLYTVVAEELGTEEENFLASIETPKLNINDDRSVPGTTITTGEQPPLQIVSSKERNGTKPDAEKEGTSLPEEQIPKELPAAPEEGVNKGNPEETPAQNGIEQPPQGAWRLMLDDPSLNDDKFTEFIKRNARKIVSSLQDAAALGRALADWRKEADKAATVQGNNTSNNAAPSDTAKGSSSSEGRNSIEDWLSHLAADLPSLDKRYLPTTWWTSAHDAALLLGSHRHGLARYDQIRSDPSLPFPRQQAASPAQAALATCTTSTTEPDAGGHQPPVEEVSKKPEGQPQPETSDPREWPGVKLLNQRFKKILRAFEQALAKKSKKKEKLDKGEADEKTDKKWSKREKYDFQRSLVRHGVPVDSEGAYCWDKIRASARLSRKTPKAVEKYYVAFLERAKNSIQEHKNQKKSGTKTKKKTLRARDDG